MSYVFFFSFYFISVKVVIGKMEELRLCYIFIQEIGILCIYILKLFDCHNVTAFMTTEALKWN